jgi:hypothetical protein
LKEHEADLEKLKKKKKVPDGEKTFYYQDI